MSDRIAYLQHMVNRARQEVEQAERNLNNGTRDYHLAKTTLREREEELAQAKEVEEAEARR